MGQKVRLRPTPYIGNSPPIGPYSRPRRWATAPASPRLLTSSLARIRETWTLAVFSLMNSSSPIWRFVRPAATRLSTSRSRGGQAERGVRGPARASRSLRAIRVRRASASISRRSGSAPDSAASAWASRSGLGRLGALAA